MSDNTITVADLLAKEQIRDVLMRYSRGVDRLDRDLLRSCFHDESTDDHGHFKGSGHEFADFIVGSLAGRAHHTSHTVANVLIEIDDLDAGVAHAESYGIAYLRRSQDDVEWLDVFAGRYIDRFERRADQWRIADRTVVHDWSMSLELDPASSFPLVIDGFVQGTRDRSDPAYLR